MNLPNIPTLNSSGRLPRAASLDNESARTSQIQQFIRRSFPLLFAPAGNGSSNSQVVPIRLGFDVAASGKGDLAAMYLAEPVGSVLWLRALFSARTDDWHFLKTVLFYFLSHRPKIQGAGDESSLGRQICWEAAQHFPSRFSKVNFGAKKSDLGFSLMNQLSSGEKRFPKSHDDIAADFFALRKAFIGGKWVFSETRNSFNPASHCDIAWAAALASYAHSVKRSEAWALAG
jgi:phage FluMu gp28-like protein